jgi:tetratricopeptide (TPR) repeat protein/transglutaminase-like putative cysteine protease
MRSVPHTLELLLFGALTIAAAATAQTPTSASTPDPQKADPLSFSKDATVIEDLQVKVRFENDGKAVYETSLRAKIQSESAVRNNGLIAFSYFASNESLDIKYVRVRKPDGTLVETPLDSVQDLTSDVARSAPMYTDQHEKHVAVKGLSVGDTLEYRTVSTVIKPLAPGQFWFSHNFSKQTLTLHELLEINVPKDRAVRVLSPGNSPVVSEDGTRRIYTFQSSHLKKDPDPEKWEQALNGDPSPEVQVTSFATWDEVAAWYGTLQKLSMQVTPEIRAKAEELTRGKSTDIEKIRALYDYVSSKFRYISISLGQGRYAPHGASEVLANQFGDCKDKHTLLAALLQAVGIDAYPVLISSSMKIDSAMPTPGLFDHVITAVPQKDSFLLLDTTPGVAPFALLSRPLRDKLALVGSPGNKGLLIKTPVDPPFPFFQHFTMTATLDSGGTLEGKARVEVRGDAELLLREAFRDTPQSGWKELAQAYSAASGFGGTVDDVSAADSSDTSAPFWFTYSYHRPEYGDWPNHRIILPFPRMGLPELTKEETESAATFPLGPQQELTYEARLTLPKDLWPSLNPTVQEKRDFADYQSSYALEDRVLQGTRHLRLLLREIPGAKRPQYVSLYKAVDEDERRWINLLGATTPPASPSTSSEAQHFFDEGSRSIQLGAPWAATTSLERAVKLDPSWFDAWLLLGDARLMASRPDPAVEAYRIAISLDPTNIRGYETLSKSLVSLHRTEDAVQVWRDLLKVIPDNLEASENLAMLLAASAKYAEARPVLEKAIEHSLDNPSLRFQLGCTYIQLGLEDQASEQFQKAIELRPDPEMRSAIAYALAEAKRHLPDALRYAEEAVQETEARTASIDLSPSAMKEGYGLMGNLAAEWDTLGWVNFRLGNLTAAEKYAVAAWKLSQLPSIGDHLGQIYEKQGKKIQALHAFGLALAVLPADGDPKLREKLLSRMTAGGSQSSSWGRNKKEVEEMHSFSLQRIGEKDESAFFAVVSSNDSEVAEVKFLNGPEELREAESAIAAIKFSTTFPDATPIRIFRGGTLSCNQFWKECRFMLFPYPPRILFPPQAH